MKEDIFVDDDNATNFNKHFSVQNSEKKRVRFTIFGVLNFSCKISTVVLVIFDCIYCVCLAAEYYHTKSPRLVIS